MHEENPTAIPGKQQEVEETEVPTAPLRQSTRRRKPTQCWIESKEQERQVIALPIALEVAREAPAYDPFDENELSHPFLFAASSDPDTLYYHQAMKEKDAPQFRQAMQKELDDHTKNGHWKIIRRADVPKGHKVLDSV